MAITWVHERFQERRSGQRIDGSRSHTRTFQVLTDDKEDDGPVILEDSDIPALGDIFPVESPEEPEAACVDRTIRQDPKSPNVWIVECRYESSTGDQLEEKPANPLDREPEIEFGWLPYSRVIDQDREGGAVVNSAGERFDPLPEIDDNRLVLRMRRNEASFDFVRAMTYLDGVNDADWLGFDAGEAKIGRYSGVRRVENGVEFWVVTYEVHFRIDGWTLEVLDRGYARDDGSGNQVGNAENILDDDDNIVGQSVKPKLLDGSGEPIDPFTDPPVFLEFDVYEPVDFDALDFPIDLIQSRTEVPEV